MKKILILSLLLAGCGTLRYIAPRSEKPRRVDGGILFEYYAPSAARVALAGEFNNWEKGNSEKAILLEKREDGIWQAVVPLIPGRYKYKFVIDDTKWEANPNGESANDADGNSLIVVE